ncbi:hypothetical protein SAMN05660420_01115 [Desulfuromusa kysingii]|uniref:Uncharacterized protein n=1 Tax=Desulfuromusa kysingii TaxID=37625 RepID=A0A1H3Y6M2_9BACT|nr:hypothetical protein [Desulfuromusa kysingii]SEA07266.1 hypothetical protein SAMN05660420_01115 [Desulfuromusa kysingii]
MFCFIVLLLVVGAGFYFYQKLMTIEREIRAEQKAEGGHTAVAQAPEKPVEDFPDMADLDQQDSSAKIMSGQDSVEEAIISAVAKSPGLIQTELYAQFVDADKKQLQKMIKKMADSGTLRREKQGSSYTLYLA